MNEAYKARQELLKFCGNRRYAAIEGLPAAIGKLCVQSITEFERNEILKACEGDAGLMRPLMIAYSIVDAEGIRVFGDQDVSKIQEMDVAITNSLAEAAELHCGFMDTESEQVEEVAKN